MVFIINRFFDGFGRKRKAIDFPYSPEQLEILLPLLKSKRDKILVVDYIKTLEHNDKLLKKVKMDDVLLDLVDRYEYFGWNSTRTIQARLMSARDELEVLAKGLGL